MTVPRHKYGSIDNTGIINSESTVVYSSNATSSTYWRKREDCDISEIVAAIPLSDHYKYFEEWSVAEKNSSSSLSGIGHLGSFVAHHHSEIYGNTDYEKAYSVMYELFKIRALEMMPVKL